MKKVYKSLLILVASFVLLSSILIFAQLFNTDFGKVKVQSIRIHGENITVAGYLYEPRKAENLVDLPAVVLIHGIMNAKETMTALALELARNGVIALSIDALGHGSTIGDINTEEDPSLGGVTAVRYLKSLSYVNSSNIGLVGHSMGVGAIRATSVIEGGIKAHIFVGGVSLNNDTLIYGELNQTSPTNLLVVIGLYDELFDLQQVEEMLQPAFGTSEIEIGNLYGSFSNGTARKLISPKTTHLFELLSSDYISESVSWMTNSFGIINGNKTVLYPSRDTFIFIAFFVFAGLFVPISNVGLEFDFFKNRKQENERKEKFTVDTTFSFWSIGLTWSFLHLILFVPPILLFGMNPIIIPLYLGFTAIFWLLSLTIVGILIIFFIIKYRYREIPIKQVLLQLGKKLSNWKGLILAVNCFLLMVIIDLIIEQIPGMSMKIIVPLFSEFTGIRALMFLVLIPFMFLYFVVDGFISTGIYEKKLENNERKRKIWVAVKITGLKLLPLILILLLQYFPMLILGSQLFTGFLGFSMQFIIILLPLFLIYSIATLWFYEKTQSIETGALFNACLFAWTLSTLLPIY